MKLTTAQQKDLAKFGIEGIKMYNGHSNIFVDTNGDYLIFFDMPALDIRNALIKYDVSRMKKLNKLKNMCIFG